VIDFATLVFNAHKRFLLASAAPLINVLISSLFLIFFHDKGQFALTYGLLIGVGIQLVLILSYLKYLALPLTLIRIKFDSDLKKILSLSFAIVLGVFLANMNLVVDQVMASMLGEGAVSQIGYANRFHNLLVQVVVMSVSAVLLTQLTSLVVQQNTESIKRLFQSLSSLIIFIGIIISISIYLLGQPLISVLLERGAMTEDDVSTIASLWFFYAIGLIPLMWGIALAKFFQATRAPTLITALAFLSFLLNVTLNLILMRLYGILGLAISTSLTYLIIALLYHFYFSSNVQFVISNIFRKVLPVMLVSLFFLFYENDFHDGLPTLHTIILAITVILVSGLILNVKKELIFIRDTYD
jgi:putative peptidoglycan lipid II flippase